MFERVYVYCQDTVKDNTIGGKMEREEIKYFANLSNLKFSEEELIVFKSKFEGVLKLVDQVKEANIKKALRPETVRIDSLRSDEIKKSLTQEEVLKNAPKQSEGCFVTPQVVE